MAHNKNHKKNNNGDNRPTPPATAPYNFVPLPMEPVPSPLSLFLTEKDSATGKVKLNFSKYADYIAENGKYDGVIDFEITALTPLFIGDGTGKFFAPDGKPMIPGSTIRGMVKNYLKILSCGTMRSANNEDITSRHLYFRDMASTCRSLKSHYEDKLVIKGSKKRSSKTKASAGFFARLKSGEYVIYPAELGYGHYGRSDMESKSRSKENIGRIYYSSGNEVELHSGPIPNKKTYYIFSISSWDHPIKVSDSVITDYKNDIARKGHNLLSQDQSIHDKYEPASGKEFSLLKPCFYIEENKKVKHFGASKFYRIPYDMAIEDSIPSSLKNENIIDFAEAIFGRNEDFASRIFFEDASIIDNPALEPESEAHSIPLMEPKPTSFQFYLEQKKQTDQSNLKHWDSGDTKIRGYKLYWHKKIGKDGWVLKGKKVEKTLPIHPVPKDSKFKGRIRFKNLSEIELGALITVLSLGDSRFSDGRFKIGMGKPIGLGSIDFRCKELKKINRAERYSVLFNSDGNWESSLSDIKDAEAFKSKFESYMKGKTGDNYGRVLSALKIMMLFDNKINPEDIEYMALGDDRFKKRIPLPYPKEIIQHSEDVKK